MDNSQDQTGAVYSSSSSPRRAWWRRKRIILVGVVCLCALIIGGYYVTSILREQSADDSLQANGVNDVITNKTVCSDEVNAPASAAIAEGDITALEPITQRVQELPDYKNDVNCDYILARYYLMVQDSDRATEYIAQLRRLNVNAVGLSAAFGNNPTTVDNLQSSAQDVKRNQKSQDSMNQSSPKDIK